MNLATLLGMYQTSHRRRQVAQDSFRRGTRLIEEQLIDEFDKNADLALANRRLKEENARLMHLLRFMADRSEAFLRLATHLRDAWDPDQQPQIETLNAAIQKDIDENVDWHRRRDEALRVKLQELARSPKR
jgi:hypothetical protein